MGLLEDPPVNISFLEDDAPVDSLNVTASIHTKDGPYRPSQYVTWIIRFGGAMLLVLGVVGNVLTVVVVRSMRTRSAAYFFMVFLALSDLIVLFTDMINKWYQYTFGYGYWTILDFNMFACKVVDWLLWSSATASTMLVVAVCISAAVEAVRPHKTSSRNRLLLHAFNIDIWAVSYTSNVYINLLFLRRYSLTTGRCTVNMSFHMFYGALRRWLILVFLALLPAIVLIVCNVVIFRVVTRPLVFVGPRRAEHLRRHKMTRTVLVISVAFVVLTVPHVVVRLVGILNQDKTWEQSRAYTNLLEICHLVYLARSAVFFYIYLATNDAIRSRTILIMRRCMLSCGASSIAPEGHSGSSEDRSHSPPSVDIFRDGAIPLAESTGVIATSSGTAVACISFRELTPSGDNQAHSQVCPAGLANASVGETCRADLGTSSGDNQLFSTSHS